MVWRKTLSMNVYQKNAETLVLKSHPSSHCAPQQRISKVTYVSKLNFGVQSGRLMLSLDVFKPLATIVLQRRHNRLMRPTVNFVQLICQYYRIQ